LLADQTHLGFQTTRWTLLGRLRCDEPRERTAALDLIVRLYWPAVYSSLRASGRPREEAAELTQAFFADVVLGRGLLAEADQSRGRLRTLLLTALKRFTIDHHRRSAADPARGAPSLCELEREEAIFAATGGTDPDMAFERRWALALLNQALERGERHFRLVGKSRNWEAFAARVIVPAVGNCPAPPLASVAGDLGFATPADAAAAIQTVKKRILTMLRQLVAETLGDPAEADLEYARIAQLLA
jgi:hypothetical protein